MHKINFTRELSKQLDGYLQENDNLTYIVNYGTNTIVIKRKKNTNKRKLLKELQKLYSS